MKNKMFLTIATVALMSINSLSFATTFYTDMLAIINSDKPESNKIKLILEELTKNKIGENEVNPIIFFLENPQLTDDSRVKILNIVIPKCTPEKINYVDSHYKSALFSACNKLIKQGKLGFLETVKLLIKYGANINSHVISVVNNNIFDDLNFLARHYLTSIDGYKEKSIELKNLIKLAEDYDNAESNRMQFLDNLWKEREAYRVGKSKTPNKYGLEDAYNILVYRSMIIKPLKTDPGYKDETKRTLFSGKTPEEMRKLHKFAEVGFTEAKSGPMNRIQTETPPVKLKSGERKKFVPLITETEKKKAPAKKPVKKTESQLKFEKARAVFEKKGAPEKK